MLPEEALGVVSAITASRRKDLSDGFYLYKNIYLIGLRSKAWDDVFLPVAQGTL